MRARTVLISETGWAEPRQGVNATPGALHSMNSAGLRGVQPMDRHFQANESRYHSLQQRIDQLRHARGHPVDGFGELVQTLPLALMM